MGCVSGNGPAVTQLLTNKFFAEYLVNEMAEIVTQGERYLAI
jgi:hypothetical protein